jgi:phage terminase small subunit
MAVIETEIVKTIPEVAREVARSINPALGNGLTLRTNRFIDHWLKNGNGTESARIAGFNGNEQTLAVTASQLLRNPKVAAEIKRRLGKHIASADEVLETLTNHSRADLAEVLESDGSFNLAGAKRRGVSRLLKKLKVKTRYEKDAEGNPVPVTEHEFELHDAQAATVHLGKFHKLFADKSEVEVSIDSDRLADSIITSLMAAAARKRLEAESTAISCASEPAQPPVIDTTAVAAAPALPTFIRLED